MQDIIVTGATSQVGDFLLPMLGGREVLALSRTPPEKSPPNIRWLKADIGKGLPENISAQVLVHLAPLWLLPPLLPAAAACGVSRIVAFGSTSRFSKEKSGNPAERALSVRLGHAEEEIAQQCGRLSIDWTLLRPTMVYGSGRDKNVAAIARFVRRFGFFPLVGGGRGLRQPVHAQDLATAVVSALESPLSRNRAYDLSGGETLSYREMAARIFKAEGRRERFVDIPLPLLQALLLTLSLLPKYRHLSAEMAVRMNQDLCFDHKAASADFGYSPRPFLP